MQNTLDDGNDGKGGGGRLLGSLQSVLGEARFLGDKLSLAKAALDGSGGLVANCWGIGLLGACCIVMLSSVLILSFL